MFDNLVTELNEIQAQGVDVNLSFSNTDYMKMGFYIFLGLFAALVLSNLVAKKL
jgi:prepilin signal peptidase PulO-like enzyme (type II secretory pathway)